jgi:hypothetical protein
MTRRRLVLKWFLSAGAALPLPLSARARRAAADVDRGDLLALAAAVLPSELGEAGIAQAADAFQQWLKDYRPGAELDQGYGDPRLAQAADSPASRYRAQLDDLRQRCGARLAAVPLPERRRVIAQALEDAKLRSLPLIPDGGHVATDLMAHYFNGADANDRMHGRYIGRFACRGLPGSELRPPALNAPSAAPASGAAAAQAAGGKLP